MIIYTYLHNYKYIAYIISSIYILKNNFRIYFSKYSIYIYIYKYQPKYSYFKNINSKFLYWFIYINIYPLLYIYINYTKKTNNKT